MKIGKLTIHLSFEWEGKYMSEVKKALRNGQVLMAIKIYKEGSGNDLRTSINYVRYILKPKYYKEPKWLDD